MAKTKKAPTARKSTYIESPEDQCTNVAGRMTAVLMLLDGYLGKRIREREDLDWSLITIQELLRNMRADLLKSVAHDEAQQAGGGAR